MNLSQIKKNTKFQLSETGSMYLAVDDCKVKSTRFELSTINLATNDRSVFVSSHDLSVMCHEEQPTT